jgi:photosystem II stability/assembly factor-like uncharacterized protein
MLRARLVIAVLFATLSPVYAEWKALGPFGGSIQALQVDPHNRDTVVAATANGLLFRSTNGGESWTTLPFPAELRATLHTLVLDPVNPNTYFAGLSSESPGYAGIFRSRDAGATWERLAGLRNQQVWSLALWPADARVMAAGTEDGLYVTTDAGETWRRISPEANGELRPVVSIAFDPRDRNVIYTGTPHLAWKTTDGGANWMSIRAGMPSDSDVFSILVDRNQAQRVFAGACSGLYRSVNGGATWIKLSGARDASYRTYFVEQHPTEANIVYAGTNKGLIQSLDGGTTWRKLSGHLARAISFDRAHVGWVFVATEDAGVLRSNDGGLHIWESNQGLCSRHLSPLAESGGALFSSVLGERTTRAVFKLPAASSRWERASDDGAFREEVRQVATVSGAPKQLYTLAGGALMRSADGGLTWLQLPAPARLTALLAPAAMLGQLFAASESGLLRSRDGGSNWEWMQLPAPSSTIRELVALPPSAIAAIEATRVFLSTDGSSWKASAALPGNPNIYGLAGIGSNGLLAATSAGLMRSDDFGDSWRTTGGNLGGTSIQAIARHPMLDRVYFAAAFGVVYESRDDGDSWQRILPEGPSMGRITQLLAVPGDPGRLFILTEARGVFELDREALARAGAASPQPK